MNFMTDAQAAAIAAERRKQNKAIFDFVTAHPATPRTYAQIKALVQAGHGPEIFNVGDEIPCTYTYNGTEYDYPWIVGNPDCTSIVMIEGEEIEVPSVLIFPKYCTPEDVPLDPAWHETPIETKALEGRYYCGRNGSTYTMLGLAVGDDIPFESYESVYYGAINNVSVYQNGYNNYIYGCRRPWLNSDAARGEWMDGAERLEGQTNPTQLATVDGYMSHLPADFLAMVGPVKRAFACNTVTDGGRTEYFYDTFADMSIEEMYGAPQIAGVEGPYIPYWKDVTGLSAPSNNANAGRVIRACNQPTGSAQTVRLRSSYRSGVNYGFYCVTSGRLNNTVATSAYRALPDCFIR